MYWQEEIGAARRLFAQLDLAFEAHDVEASAKGAAAGEAALIVPCLLVGQKSRSMQVSSRILGRRTAPFPTFPYSSPRPAWRYPKILVPARRMAPSHHVVLPCARPLPLSCFYCSG